MADTLKTQIDNVIGAGLASSLYDNWLVAGARTTVDILKDEDLERHSSSVVIPITTGLNVTLYRIWQILVGGNSAIQRITGNETQAVDSNSFYKAGPYTPAYIIQAGTLKCYDGTIRGTPTLVSGGTGYGIGEVLTFGTHGFKMITLTVDGSGVILTWQVYDYGSGEPGGTYTTTSGFGSNAQCSITITENTINGTLIGIQYPTAIDSSIATDITGVPENMHYATILYACIQARLKQISNISDDMTTLITGTIASVTNLITTPIADIASIATVAEPTLTTYLAAMETALTAEDIELVTANINDLNIRLEQWKQQVTASNVAFEAGVLKGKTMFEGDLAKAKAEFEGVINRVSSELSTLKTKIDGYTQKLQVHATGLQQLQAEYHGLINLYLGKSVPTGASNGN